jgi:hypothetical protein
VRSPGRLPGLREARRSPHSSIRSGLSSDPPRTDDDRSRPDWT